MTIKVLEPARYSEIPVPISDLASVIVAEDPETKAIKGYWVAQPVMHIEPIWLDPDIRNNITGIKMFAAMLALLNAQGITGFYANAATPEVQDYLQRLGLELKPYLTFEGVVPPMPAREEQN